MSHNLLPLLSIGIFFDYRVQTINSYHVNTSQILEVALPEALPRVSFRAKSILTTIVHMIAPLRHEPDGEHRLGVDYSILVYALVLYSMIKDVDR